MFFVLSRAWDKEKILTPHEESNLRLGFRAPMLYRALDSSWGLRIFSFVPRSWQDESIFLYFFTELKTYHLSYSIYKHDAIDIADPSRMEDAYHMNLVIDLAHHSLCGSVVERRSAKSEGLSSIPHGDSEFFLCSTLETKNIFLWLIVVLLQCRFLMGRQKQCDTLRNRTAESQSDCKDHQWFQNGWKKSKNLQVNKGFKIMIPSSVYLGGFQRERNQGNQGQTSS